MTLACHTYMRIKLCKQTRRGIFLSSRKHFTNSSSSSRGNGDNNANKEDGGQRAGWREAGVGSRKQRPEVRHIFRLKCHNMLTSSRDNDSDNELNETAPARQQQFNIHIYFYFHFISLGSRYCWLYYFYCCCSCSYCCCFSSWQLCQKSHVNICTPFLGQVSKTVAAYAEGDPPELPRLSCQNLRRTFILMLPGDIKRRFQGLRLVKRCWLCRELQIRWELKIPKLNFIFVSTLLWS